MLLKNVVLVHLILTWLNSTRAQITGPTVTDATSASVSIVPGSISIISVSSVSSVDLLSTISGLVPTNLPITTATSSIATSFIFVAGSPSQTMAASTSSLAVPAVNSQANKSSKLSTTDLAGIIGGCAGAVLIVFVITIIWCVRKRKAKLQQKDYDIEPNNVNVLPLSKLESDKLKQHQVVDGEIIMPDINDKTIKRYNAQKKPLPDPEVITPPVILYTDAHNSTTPQKRPQRGVSQAGARLSKYNFLSQAFSQMRSSYGGDHGSLAAPEMAHHSGHSTSASVDRSYLDSMVLSSYDENSSTRASPPTNKRYQMYSMYNNDSSTTNQLPLPLPSSTQLSEDTNRESTFTVGTLHAPLFRQQDPLPKRQYSPLADDGRESALSDVSQYSTFPATTNSPNTKYPFF